MDINQTHYGSGDNIGGDKIVKVVSLSLDDFPGVSLNEKVRNFVLKIGHDTLKKLETDRVAYVDLTPTGIKILLPAQEILLQQEILAVEDRHNLRIEPGKDQLSGYTLRALKNF